MAVASWICLAAPLAAVLTITLLGTSVSRRLAGYISTGSVFVSFVAAVVAFASLLGESPHERQHASTLWTWLTGGSFETGLRILTDPLSVFMMLVVSGVGFLIVAYSIGYMDGDDEERRYFAYMALFVFSMLLLVEGGNFLMLLVGWGLVGLSSYLLIGFWHERPTAVAAAKKAFVMNALGDATMALAFFLLIQRNHTLNFPGAFSVHGGGWFVNLVALGLLGGAVAKSAQIPLQTWLPDAMEGPTPVSALIHAATMVTAGVYLIVRTHAIFEQAPKVADMAAGIVIHALAAEQDMRKMGGLRALMPRTYWAFLIGSLALVGVFPFAGFFSKDSILAAAMDHGTYGYILWAVGLAGTFLTGLYTFRLLFVVFWGEPSAFVREHFHALRRDVVGVSMSATVGTLAVLSVVGGWIQFAPFWHPIETWLQVVAEPTVGPSNW